MMASEDEYDYNNNMMNLLRSDSVLLRYSDAEYKPPLSPILPSSSVSMVLQIDEPIINPSTVMRISSQVYPLDYENESGAANNNSSIIKDEWLPLTESRKGNMYSAVFHLLNSNIGFQALMLPLAFPTLGWAWGSACLSIAFFWQLYTLFLLVRLHESVPGIRHSRFLFLAIAAFGRRIGIVAALFPVMYLSGATCVMLIITGGGTLRLLFKTICEDAQGVNTCHAHSLTGVEWFLVFMCAAILVALFLPNLNSVAPASFIGAVAALAYCTLFWALSVKKGRPDGLSYSPAFHREHDMPIGAKLSDIMIAIGTILLAFRGHNVLLEIQGTLPSDVKGKSKVTMTRAVVVSYLVIAMCLFPLAIAGFWAYGNQMPEGGLLTAFPEFHRQQVTKFTMGAMYLLVIIHCLSSYQVYAMPVFDNLELRYITMKNRRCSRLVRTCLRVFFGGFTFFISVTFPFLPSLSALLGGITLVPVTYAYPCFMWLLIKKPRARGVVWSFNLALGCLGMILGALLVAAAIRTLVVKGLNANFYKP